MKKSINSSYWLVHLTDDISTEISFSSRFVKDKLYIDTEDKTVVIDGILLNKVELFEKYSVTSLEELAGIMIAQNEECFFCKFRGPFTGLYYNKQDRTFRAFGNQTGDSSVFYAVTDQGIFISNNFNAIAEKLHSKHFDEQAAHYLLTYGFIIDDSTILREIKRVQAGRYLKVRSGNQIETPIYHRLTFSPSSNITMDEAVETLDRLFRHAVTRCFEKDCEYGYMSHLADISAGLDSRMVNWVANDLGYGPIVNISYSQSDCDEKILSQKVSNKLGNQFYFRSLDDCSFIYDVDNLVEKEFATAYYCGITGGEQFLKLIDFERFGLEHTGQIGDAVIGTIFKAPATSSALINIDTHRNSTLLPLRAQKEYISSQYQNQEQFILYTRAFQGALATHYIRANYTYAVSAFLDVDLLDFLSTLPYELRAGHRLYWEWIDKKYPDAGRLKSTRHRPQRTHGAKLTFFMQRVYARICRDIRKSGYKLRLVRSSVSSNNMNPHTFWYETNPKMRNFIDTYYNDNIHRMDGFPRLKEECVRMFGSSTVLDRLMVLTLLSAHRIYCQSK